MLKAYLPKKQTLIPDSSSRNKAKCLLYCE